MPNMWGDIIGGPNWASWKALQDMAQLRPAQRQVPDLQPYTEAMGYVPPERYGSTLMNSPSGPRGAAFQAPGPTPAWLERVRRLLGNATVGLDPARPAPPRTIQTTDPGAGYGMSPSGPTAQMPARQPQIQQPQARMPRQNVTEQFSVPANYGQSPSNPNWQPRTPKPMSPFYEPPVPPTPPTGGP